jgi:hypothetical protein
LITLRTYAITIDDGRSTEELVAAGAYGYAHSCVTSENFPVRSGARRRAVVLLAFEREMTTADAIRAATRAGLERPRYEDALAFGAEHPDAQRGAPIVFLHEPWHGYFGRWDVMCLWENAGRRELGLEDVERRWPAGYRFAFVDASVTTTRIGVGEKPLTGL